MAAFKNGVTLSVLFYIINPARIKSIIVDTVDISI